MDCLRPRFSNRWYESPTSTSGYFRPPMERPPANNVSFHPAGQNIVPAGKFLFHFWMMNDNDDLGLFDSVDDRQRVMEATRKAKKGAGGRKGGVPRKKVVPRSITVSQQYSVGHGGSQILPSHNSWKPT
ncbi:hypothetical protein SSX86_010708 [Deinandra increscens subsp. villosa]|uniref:Uncharacterized protein n=1 Tax=Deinandra increscens subsp. villosa TaxID=3103831 RepID=A0AAP0DD03_9ASTR